jgi:hypothetical protein
MCTYLTISEPIEGSAKGPGGPWMGVATATVYLDHPVHAMADHTVNIDLADPARGPGARIGIELTLASARTLVDALQTVLAAGLAT